MGEGVGHDVAPGLLLEPVVADLEGGVEGRVDVARVEEVVLLLAVVGPDPGEVVGLEFEPDRRPVRLGLVAGRPGPVDDLV